MHFATCDDASEKSHEGAGLFLPVGTASELGLRIYLPPPYITRLYRQRGLFMAVTRELMNQIRERCYKIVFPAQPRCPAKIVTEDQSEGEAELKPVEPWFDSLKEWAMTHASVPGITDNPLAAMIAFAATHGNHPAQTNFDGIKAYFDGRAHLNAVISYVWEVAGRVTSEGRLLDPRVLDVLERDNPAFFDWFRDGGRGIHRCDQSQ